VLAGATAAAIFALGTASPGPGLDPDAQSYVGAAASLAHSGAYRVPTSSWTAPDSTAPLTHFPPGFSTAIAGPIILGLDPLQAARLIIVLAAFGTWATLVALLTTVVSIRAGLLTALAALATPALVTVHLSILSEPAFLTTLLAVVAGLWTMTRSPRLTPALGTGLAAAAAVMLRYAGLSLTLAALWWAVMEAGRGQLGLSGRVKRAALVAMPTGITLGLWLLRAVRLEGGSGVRTIGVYGGFGGSLLEAVETIASWAVPLGPRWWRIPAAGLLLGGVCAMAGVGWRARRSGHGSNSAPTAGFLTLVATVGSAYVGFVVVSRLVADPNIPFDERILAPVVLLIEMAACLIVAGWWGGRQRRSHALLGAVGITWLAASAVVSVSRIVVAREDGNDFAGSDWRDSPTLAWVRSPNAAARVLYTNWPAAVYFQAHRAAHDLPDALDGLTLRRFHDRLVRNHGLVVGFAAPSPDVAPPDSIARLMGLHEVAAFPDGAVWEVAGDTATR
jgi:hypothetical protein